MSEKDSIKREYDTVSLALSKDIEHLDYRITEQDKDTEFLKTHISSKHKEQSEKIQKTNDRIDAHIATETEFQQRIHKEILDKFAKLDVRMSALEKWKAVIYGGIITIITVVGYILQAKINLK
jgi:predicted Holliday junction resolvase-like endonuclease